MRRVFAVLLLAAACTSTRPASFDDARITEDVAGALRADHINGIMVSVTSGRVRLAGIVPTREQRELAALDAERVPGVVAVENQIEVPGKKP
jgi:osmotically-inducible protein OsmY